jgi:hypothetical protein
LLTTSYLLETPRDESQHSPSASENCGDSITMLGRGLDFMQCFSFCINSRRFFYIVNS